jgi:signal peptide peptidase SppA
MSEKQKKEHVLVMEAIFADQWAILPSWLDKIVAIAQGQGNLAEAQALREMRQVEGSYRTGKTADGTAIIGVFGPIVPRAGLMTQYSGATSFQQLTHELEASMADPGVRQIIFNIDSPGGTVTGNEELGAAIREASKKKKIMAFVSGQAASAAYWLASACPHIYGLQTSMYGSIGTVITLYDDKEALAKDGIKKYDIVSAVSPHKRPDVSTKEGRAHYQAIVDAMAEVFVSKVAEYRGVSIDTVLKNFGGGAMYLGQEAVTRGMADGITTLENLLTNGANMSGKNQPAAPSAETPAAPVEGTATPPVAPATPAPAPVAAPAAAAPDYTKTPEFAAAVAAAAANLQATEAARIKDCESLKAKAPAYAAFIDKKKMEPGMTKAALMEAILEDQSKRTGKIKAERDEDIEALNEDASAVAGSGDLPAAGADAETQGAIAMMLEGASQHHSRQYTALASGDPTGAALKK